MPHFLQSLGIQRVRDAEPQCKYTISRFNRAATYTAYNNPTTIPSLQSIIRLFNEIYSTVFDERRREWE